MNYIKYHEALVESWNQKLQCERRKCFLFGAHITTQFFSAYGLKMNYIEAILDNDNYKLGRRVCGTDKRIFSPKHLKDLGNAVVIIPNSPYAEEIKSDIIDNINSLVEFW